jgi:hypothetical protein
MAALTTAVVGFVTKHVAAIGSAVLAAVIAVFAGHFLWTNEDLVVHTKLLPPDTPPAEYLYLDSERALAYLGQVEGGLTASEIRTESETESQSASLKGGLLAEINGSRQRQASVQSTVTPDATDRFFTLLIKLRSGREKHASQSSPWLHEIDAHLDRPTGGDAVRKQLLHLREGDFVRISDAHLYLPPYAAITPRARYAASYLGGDISQPARPLYAPISPRSQQAIKRYLTTLGADPILPFVLPTLTAGLSAKTPVIFFVPARYSDLLDNPRLLAGNLTVVGKVVYVDAREPADQSCTVVPCTYLDRQTLTTFAPALQKAPQTVLHSLKINRSDVLQKVKASATFHSPIAVVLPVAIYQ